ncbi:ME53 [Philosamia cynthia ricini nucleopolyhedrovirus virus]|nr:ME53 [Philosamia cynthia ricini nucleopolyhedrovirus virus]
MHSGAVNAQSMNWFKENNIFDARKNGRATAPPAKVKAPVGAKTPPPAKTTSVVPVKAAPTLPRRPANKTEQAHAAIVKRIGRGDNRHNKVFSNCVPPEYGHRADDMSACSHKLEYARARDLREHFSSDNEREAMRATLRFATNYVTGYISSKDMLAFGRAENVNTKDGLEYVQESQCTICGYKFKDNTRPWLLYVVLREPPRAPSEGDEPEPPQPPNTPDRFDFACFDCTEEFKDPLNSFEIYPGLTAVHTKKLFESGFFYQYIFPLEFNVQYFKRDKIQIKHHEGPFETMQRLLRDHRGPNEHIMYISFSTTGGLVLKETNYDARILRYRNLFDAPTVADDVNCFTVSSPSQLMKALDDRRFDTINGTVFVEMYGFAIQEFVTGVVTFPVRPVKGNYCVACKKTKLYHNNPVICCSRCGFTNRFVFGDKYDALYFHWEAVQTHKEHNELVRYYDLKLHARICDERLKAALAKNIDV